MMFLLLNHFEVLVAVFAGFLDSWFDGLLDFLTIGSMEFLEMTLMLIGWSGSAMPPAQLCIFG